MSDTIAQAPQGAIPKLGIPDSMDIPRLVYAAPYFTTVPLAELIEPSVLEAVESMLPGLVPPYVQDAANTAVAQQAVMLTGSTMSGALYLNPTLPTQPSQAASMAYVDLMISTAGVPEVPPTPVGQTWARQTGQWVPVDETGGVFLPITGGTMQGAINMSGNGITNLPAIPQMPNGAASATWVLNQIAANSLYQGTWTPETNTPDLTLPGNHQNGFTWICVTSNTSGVVVSQPIPGLQGLTVYNGDNIIYGALVGQFQIVRSGGLSLGEAQALFLPLAGGQMSGALLLNEDATSTMQATTLQQVEALAAFPESPTDGQVYGRQGLSTSWMPVLPLGGGVLTGQLTLAANAVQPLNAVPLQQLNSTLGGYVPLAGNATIIGPLTMSGAGANLTLNSNAAANLQAVPLQQLTSTLATYASQAYVNTAVAPALNNVGRNLLHNPLFNVAQRGAGPWASGYTADRWTATVEGTGATLSVQMNAAGDGTRSQIGDEACTSILGASFGGTSGASDAILLSQLIEDVRRLAGKTVSVSFWAQASALLRIGIGMYQSFGTGGSPSTAVNLVGQSAAFNAANTMAQRFTFTFSVPSVSGKTLGTNGDDFIGLQIWFSGGSAQNPSNGSVGVQSGSIYLWGIQLEIGSVATPLEKPDPRYDLANCQRFFANYAATIGGWVELGVSLWSTMPFTGAMRATPTVAINQVNASSDVTVAVDTVYGSGAVFHLTNNGAAGSVGWAQFSYTASADL
jgi:hypothetical protein